jgi:hypothetical protein
MISFLLVGATPRLYFSPDCSRPFYTYRRFLCTDAHGAIPPGVPENIQSPGRNAPSDPVQPSSGRLQLNGLPLQVLLTAHAADNVGGDKFIGRVLLKLTPQHPVHAWLAFKTREGVPVLGKSGLPSAVLLKLRYVCIQP